MAHSDRLRKEMGKLSDLDKGTVDITIPNCPENYMLWCGVMFSGEKVTLGLHDGTFTIVMIGTDLTDHNKLNIRLKKHL